MIKINNTEYKNIEKNINILDFLKENDKKLYKKAIVAKINNEKLIDLSNYIINDTQYQIFSLEDKEGLETLRHSAAHIMAQAVKTIFKDAKVTIGPVINDGFYYDFDVETPFAPEDLKRLKRLLKK